MTLQEEAIQILGKVVQDLTSPNRDLKLALRQCLHACQLLRWDKQQEWFQQEIAGYPSDITVPAYRKVLGQLAWVIEGSDLDRIKRKGEEFIYGLHREDTVIQITVDFRNGVDWLLWVAQRGYGEDTPETRIEWSIHEQRNVRVKRVRFFEAFSFVHTLEELERLTFEFASRSYAFLKYGNIVSDIWLDYRKQVDEVLHKLNLGSHLDAIQSGLQSDNSESWRSAVFECRNLLSDVADYLWQDQRKTYTPLPGKGQNGKLEVTQNRSANRIRAYLHQKRLGDAHRKFIEDEIDRLADSIRSLISFQSTGHTPVSKENARTIALATYFILGELVIKTDMSPIEKYDDPVVVFQSSENEGTIDG